MWGSIRASVQVTIPWTALLDGDAGDWPAMTGRGSLVDPETVRRLAADAATWTRLFIDPVTGVPVAVDTSTPSAAQRRWLRARDQTCRWPGCHVAAHQCEADHTIQHAHGGPTDLGNLASLCRRHHTITHSGACTMEQLPRGRIRWTSEADTVLVDEPTPAGPAFRLRPVEGPTPF